ncbi:hypothetical protein QC764_000730 [Podospora pseudoanserina]|uniref:Mannose-6-phosphate isomerase n=2 Tax=Podospora TaxID=5144 RepID=A0ABR0IGD3_9PEZI|nr:hypothetical protein QC764_000730 [Podospora pseudoanserina]
MTDLFFLPDTITSSLINSTFSDPPPLTTINMIDAQELRRRWSDKTEAVFTSADLSNYVEIPARNYERTFDFQGCKSIVFLKGERTGTEEDVILMSQGTGRMVLPAGVQVLVTDGYTKCSSNPTDAARSGSTVTSSTPKPVVGKDDGWTVVAQADGY